jgi:hypothetical protein
VEAAELEKGRLAELEAEVVKLRADLAKANAFAGLDDDMTDVTEVSVAQFSAVRARLLDAEKSKAQADARIISLEDELKQYNQVRTSSIGTTQCSSLHTPTNTPTLIQTNILCPDPLPIPAHPSTCATPP